MEFPNRKIGSLEVTDRGQEFLRLLEQEPGSTVSQLAEPRQSQKNGRRAGLKDAGLIRRIGSNRKGSWKVWN